MSLRGCLSKTSELPEWGGGRDSPPVWLLRSVWSGGMAASLLMSSHGEGCFSSKLKTIAASHRESIPFQFSILKWYLKYCCPGCPCVLCDSASDFLSVFWKLFILHFLTQNLWTGQYLAGAELCSSTTCCPSRDCLEITGWGKVLAALKYPSTWDKNKIHQQVVLDSSAGQRTDHGVSVLYREGLEKNQPGDVFLCPPTPWWGNAGPVWWEHTLLQNSPAGWCSSMACLQMKQ